MKNRIISFIPMLAILFSCLSLEIFATQSGDSSTEAVTGTQSAEAIESVINALKNPYEVTQSVYTSAQ